MIKTVLFIIAGILCCGYGILIMSVRSGTRFYAVWYLLSLFFLGLSACSFFHVWDKLPVAFVQTTAAVFGVLAAVLVGTAVVILFSGRAEDADCDTILVLGAQVRQSGPSVVLRFRLDTAADYLREHRDTTCIVSGGQGRTEPCTEAEAMKAYLVEKGIEPGRIILEPRATSTKENLELSKELCDPGHDRVGIVTNQFHMFRSVMIAGKAGYKTIVRIPAGSLPMYLPNNVLRESIAVWKDLLCGNLI